MNSYSQLSNRKMIVWNHRGRALMMSCLAPNQLCLRLKSSYDKSNNSWTTSRSQMLRLRLSLTRSENVKRRSWSSDWTLTISMSSWRPNTNVLRANWMACETISTWVWRPNEWITLWSDARRRKDSILRSERSSIRYDEVRISQLECWLNETQCRMKICEWGAIIQVCHERPRASWTQA